MKPRRSRQIFAPVPIVFSLGVATLVACAMGAEGTGDDDPIDAPRSDAATVDGPPGAIDARPPDARLVDGPVSMPDAPIGLPDGGGLTCTTNAECTAPGTCCFIAFCVPGTASPLPPPLNCAPS
jgi:hypothetical protein